jgi:hypothetical protein
LVERLTCNQQVTSSILVPGSISPITYGQIERSIGVLVFSPKLSLFRRSVDAGRSGTSRYADFIAIIPPALRPAGPQSRIGLPILLDRSKDR